VQLEKQEAQFGDNYLWSCFAPLAKPAKIVLGQGLPLPTIMSLGTQMTPVHATTSAGGIGGEGEIFHFLCHLFSSPALERIRSLFEVLGCVVLTAKACCFLQYFHPDHMSSEEKMKLELHRVRDEFKMSENDCGSARVQSKFIIVSFLHHFQLMAFYL
jgi:hypothetical protein